MSSERRSRRTDTRRKRTSPRRRFRRSRSDLAAAGALGARTWRPPCRALSDSCAHTGPRRWPVPSPLMQEIVTRAAPAPPPPDLSVVPCGSRVFAEEWPTLRPRCESVLRREVFVSGVAFSLVWEEGPSGKVSLWRDRRQRSVRPSVLVLGGPARQAPRGPGESPPPAPGSRRPAAIASLLRPPPKLCLSHGDVPLGCRDISASFPHFSCSSQIECKLTEAPGDLLWWLTSEPLAGPFLAVSLLRLHSKPECGWAIRIQSKEILPSFVYLFARFFC